jgi:two-component system response regulator ArlR
MTEGTAPPPSPGGDRRRGEVVSTVAGRPASRAAGQRILVIEDEPEIGQLVEGVLASEGYAVSRARDGEDGLRQALGGGWDLIILDLIMPAMSGPEVLARLRASTSAAPVLTKVDCLDLGAQDYLTKPFQLAELLARVRARLRERRLAAEVIQAGELSLDVRWLQADAGTGPVPLTRLEFLLLRILLDHLGEAVGKDELLASVWGLDFDPGSNVVEVCVRRLRSKFGFDLIRTVRGAGYQLAS